MPNHPQGRSVAPIVVEPEQCPGCPPGNSMPLAPGEDTCDMHAWWNYDNGSSLCVDY